MKDHFLKIPEVFKESVEKISSHPSDENKEEYVKDSEKFIDSLRNAGRVIWIGTGRQEEMADFATRLTKANDKSTFCSKDSSIPYKYRPDDLVVALSSSGETERTIHYAESAYRGIGNPTPVIAITTNPDSTLGQIAKKTGGFVVKIPGKSKDDQQEYQERQFMGKHDALTLGGTLGELYALEFILDSIGSSISNRPVMEYHEDFWSRVKDYEPDPEQYRKLYKMLPNTINYTKMEEECFPNKIIIGGLDLSGVIARAFAIRLAHCAGENEERRVNYYRDAGNIASRAGDLTIVFSGSGQKFWARALKPIKEVGGKVAGITSFPNSPLGKIADLTLEVSGRIVSRDESNLENPPKSPERALFEVRSFIAMEAFIHALVEKDRISIKAVEEKHPYIT